jgi:MOSC domain-containing protein YiiM
MAEVVAVAARATHRLAKDPQLSIRLIAGDNLIRRGGVMAIVLAAGEIFAGDAIKVEPPPLPHRALGPV